ncbi:hypothetical protein JQX08_12445 [Pseudomonas sp. UL073]|uniref:CVNH domain-containing protein n=1 Tax=Zestomonas insulae TaxID=2809017 RepID=A0ABS2IFR6_9GAMM|nr:hypothetical protein [Pseudomonas insulae]MBM7061513.1 hypothetical protein [Pseudomonas insulae]
MKKIISSLIVVGSLFATSAFAVEFSSGEKATQATCELLGQDVVLNLSKNVYGGYGCYKANNVIKVATCHSAGSRKQETIQCAQTGTNPDNTPIYNNSGCQGTTPTDTFVSTQYGKAFVATTSGGGVGASNLTAYCESAAVLNSFVAQ